MRYLSKNRRMMSLLLRRRFTPEVLLQDIMSDDNAAVRVAGLHLFTFNQLAETESWRAHQRASWRSAARSSAASTRPWDGTAPCCSTN